MIDAIAETSPPPRSEIPRARPQDSARAQAASGLGDEPASRAAAEVGAGESRYRLAYDEELSRVFVELLDPDSGEVVQRYPPEELVRHMQDLLEEAGHGRFVDRRV